MRWGSGEEKRRVGRRERTRKRCLDTHARVDKKNERADVCREIKSRRLVSVAILVCDGL